MKTNNIFLALVFYFLLVGCSKQKGEVTYTYNKAIGVYGDIEQIRNEPLIAPQQSVENITKVFYGDNYILVGEKEKGIHVINNTNTRNISKQGFINIPYIGEFFVEGNYLYVEALYDLIKIDISNPFSPLLINRSNYAIHQPFLNANGEVLLKFQYTRATESFELGSEKEKALREHNNLFFNFNNELIPENTIPSTFLGTANKKGAANKMAYQNNHLYILGKENIVTYNDGSNGLTRTCSLNLIDDKDSELETVYLQNNKLYIGSSKSSFIVTATNCPNLISEYKRPPAPVTKDPILPNGNVAYLTLKSEAGSSNNQLQVLDVSNPSEIEVIGRLTMKSPQGLALLASNLLMVGEGQNGIRLINVADPTNPQTVLYDANSKAYDLMVHPTLPNIILGLYDNKISQYEYHTSTNSLEFLSDMYLP